MNTTRPLCTVRLAAITGLVLSTPAFAAIESRSILKTYFETGDVPTAEQFSITSLTGDPDATNPPDFLFSRTGGPTPTYSWRDLGDGGFLSDALGHPQFLADGETLRPSSGQFNTLIDSTLNLAEDRFLLGFRVLRPDGFHYGYLDFSIDAPLPGWPDYRGLTLNGWAFETDPNTPITAHFIPTPSTAALLGLSAIGACPRRRRAR